MSFYYAHSLTTITNTDADNDNKDNIV